MNEKEFIKMTDMFFDIIMKNIINCNIALELIYENDDLLVDKQQHLVLMVFYRELFERLISIKTLYHEKLIGSSNVVIRSFYETLLQLLFMLFPLEKFNEKIECYMVFFSHKRMVDVKKYIDNDPMLGNNDSWKNILEEKKKEYHTLQGKYIDIYKDKMNYYDENRKFCKSWYCLFNQHITSIPRLANKLDRMQLHEKIPKDWFTSIHQKIYNYLSGFSHGINVLDTVQMIDNEIYINDVYSLINASVGITYVYKLIETYNACILSSYPNFKFDILDMMFLNKLEKQICEMDNQQI